MNTSRHVSLIATVFAAACCASVSTSQAQWWWPPDSFVAESGCNAGAGFAAISIGGTWPDSCRPRGPITFNVVQGRIDMIIDHGYVPNPGCLTVITNWSRMADTPALSNGTYEIHASLQYGNGNVLGPTFMGNVVINCGCIADVDDGSGTGMRDGGVTIEDLLYYLVIFARGDLAADVDDGSGLGTPDGGVTIEDLLYYLARFESGC